LQDIRVKSRGYPKNDIKASGLIHTVPCDTHATV
jgi:hypothetical protein